MKVADLMQGNVTTVSPDATVGEAVVTLADGHVSALPVVDSRSRIIGVLSTTDILQAEADCATAAERERLFSETAVRDLMTARPAVIAPDADIRESAQQMLYLEIHRLFVEEDGKLVGVLSQTDVVRAVASAKI